MLHHRARVLGQLGQEHVLRGGEPDLPATPEHGVMGKVDRHILGPNHEAWAGVGFGTAKDRPHSGQKLLGAKRLRQVVVSAHVQRTNLVAFVAPGTDDDHSGDLLGIELTEDLPAVHKRKPDVEQDDVDTYVLEDLHGRGSVGCGEGLKAALFDCLEEGAAKWDVILHDQNPSLRDANAGHAVSLSTSRVAFGNGSFELLQ